MPDKANTLLVDSIQKLLRRKADRNLQRILQRTHAADIAGVMRQLTDGDRTRLFGLVPDVELQGEVLAEADREIQLTLVDRVGDDELLEILKEMFGDDAADIIELLDEERAEKVLRALSGEEGPDVDVLLGYDPDSAGGIMSTEVFALPHNTTVSEAIETLQSSHEE
ncbi:MAG: magnesium transporter, partial [Bradymonadia bacterium]